ncbi:MAG: hypothetical protein NVSMB13_19210 [Mycobacteriales bacterium]
MAPQVIEEVVAAVAAERGCTVDVGHVAIRPLCLLYRGAPPATKAPPVLSCEAAVGPSPGTGQ